MLIDFQNNYVAVLRLQTTTGYKNAYTTVATAQACEIQNLDSTQQQAGEGVASRTYKAWFDVDTDIREGDILRREDTSRKFKVIGIEKEGDNLGLDVDHLEVIMKHYSF